VRNAEFLTAEEVADRLGVHRVTVYRWAREGALTAVKLGHRVVRFRPDDVDAFIAKQAS
jgi:excisionase family DNA binding protein